VSNQELGIDHAFLRTSRDIAVRAAEWHSHSLGGAPVSAVEAITLAANFLIIVQFFLYWVRQRNWDHQRIAKAFQDEEENDQKTIIINVIMDGAALIGISSDEARRYARSIKDVVVPEDFETITTSSRS